MPAAPLSAPALLAELAPAPLAADFAPLAAFAPPIPGAKKKSLVTVVQ